MKRFKVSLTVCCSLISLLIAVAGSAAEYPTPKEGDWVVRDFRFHTEDVLPELRLTTEQWANPPASQCSSSTELPDRVQACSRSRLPMNCSDLDSR